MTQTRFTALVADADITSRVRLSVFLRSAPGIEVVGECEAGLEAIDAMTTMRPDIVFLAVDLPDVGGVEVLACSGDAAPPASVFVANGSPEPLAVLTGEGFHCLSRPVERQHLLEATEAAIRDRPGDRDQLDRRLAAVLEQLHRRARPVRDRILIRRHGSVRIVPTADIDWIGAARNYVRLHAGDETHQLRSTMSEIEQRLDPRRFLRIHRSIIVNTDRLRGVQPWFHGDSVVVLSDGTRLNISRGYRPRVQQFLDRIAATGG